MSDDMVNSFVLSTNNHLGGNSNPLSSAPNNNNTMLQNDISDAEIQAEWREHQSSDLYQQFKLSNHEDIVLDKKCDTKESKMPAQSSPENSQANNTEIISDESIDINRDGTQLDSTHAHSFCRVNKKLASAIADTYSSADWSQIEKLDVSDNDLDELRDLNKVAPAVRYLVASNNHLSQSEGIPAMTQVLKLSHNQFMSLSSFELANLQILELDHNHLENLSCLGNLRSLTKLSVVGNKVANLDGLRNLKMLTFLDISDNKLKSKLDFRDYDLEFLQDLRLDDNDLVSIEGIESLKSLVTLSANENRIANFTCDSSNGSLKSLSLNSNNLSILNLSNFSSLRVLKVDDNPRLSHIHGLSRQIEKVNMRSQPNSELVDQIIEESMWSENFISLNLAGGNLSPLSFHCGRQFSNIKKLDISAMGLETLPSNFSAIFPKLEVLNLSCNKLKSLHGVESLSFLRELHLLSNNLKRLRSIISDSRSSRKTLKLIDLRVNPVNKEFYPHVFYDSEGAVGMDINDAEILDEATTINLRDYEDIKQFSIDHLKLYNVHSLKHWDDKHSKFVEQSLVGNQQRMKKKEVYERKLIVWFENIEYLDGSRIDTERRLRERELYTREKGL